MRERDAIVDIGVLHEPGALADHDGKFLASLVENFVKRAQELCDACRRGLEGADRDQIGRAAHEICSSSGQLGALRLPRIALDLETLAGKAEGDLLPLAERFLAEVMLVCDGLEEQQEVLCERQPLKEHAA